MVRYPASTKRPGTHFPDTTRVRFDRERQIEAARAAWYEGFVAEAVDRFYRSAKLLDSSGEKHGGLLTGNDLAQWRATVEAPATYDYHGYTVAKCGPWRSDEHTSELQSLMRISYAVFCLKQKK